MKVDSFPMFRKMLMNDLGLLVERHKQCEYYHETLEKIGVNLDDCDFGKDSVLELDRKHNMRFHGFRNVHDYYLNCSGNTRIHLINKPLLTVYSKMDPIVP